MDTPLRVYLDRKKCLFWVHANPSFWMVYILFRPNGSYHRKAINIITVPYGCGDKPHEGNPKQTTGSDPQAAGSHTGKAPIRLLQPRIVAEAGRGSAKDLRRGWVVTMTLAELVRDVAEKRHAMKALKGEYDGAFAEFNDAHRDLLNTIAATNEDLSESEKKLRSAVLAAPEEEVKATVGVKIRKIKVVKYDEREATEWCRDKLGGQCLVLDKKGFEAMMKRASWTPDQFTVETVPQATIARDLSGAL